MGDRVSISFKDKEENSVCLFHHWGGEYFPKYAFNWFKGLKEKTENEKKTKGTNPITRFEPRSMLAQFIGHMAQTQTPDFKECMGFEQVDGKSEYSKPIYSNDLLSHSIYLGKGPNDGDNSDNGHFTIDINKCKMHNQNGEYIE
tara:strand:+ start:662 stop:1093 length:432 start_codon:yes stop_codon:yes gene_type:complete